MVEKKVGTLPVETRRLWIEPEDPEFSIARQCDLAGLARSSFYYQPVATESEENLRLMREIDELYLERPFYGSPRMTLWLRERGWEVNEKRVARLMRLMGLQAIVPGPHTSRPRTQDPVYPYLLEGLEIVEPDMVWCADITYVPVRHGYLYLVAIMDWYSRYVLSWELSNTLDADFCLLALDRALRRGRPAIFNTDRGSQFTSRDFTSRLEQARVEISMDGRGCAMDNLFIERLWRTVKYEDLYLRDYGDGWDAHSGLSRYFPFYNEERPHQALGYRTPAEVYFG